MAKKTDHNSLKVPSSRLARLGKFTGLATSIAGDAFIQGAKSLAQGDKPALNDLVLTPGNAVKVADQLAQLRGAAMKIGQIISMDAGDLLPPALADILARLRSSAYHMPPHQLRRVLDQNWGRNWLGQFKSFNVSPIAAASIGQVHRAITKDGRDLAIKVQYPGIAKSIDSDVDNVATILKLSGVMPKGVDIQPILEEAKQQLHQEADYQCEGTYLDQFQKLLAEDENFIIPTLHQDLTTSTILAMDYIEGQPIETLTDGSSEERNIVTTLLIKLVLRELFDFQLMQTDPNFANYLYDPHTKKIVLLDFGASRSFPSELSPKFKHYLKAGLTGTPDELRAASIEIGLFDTDSPTAYTEFVMRMIISIFEALRSEGDHFDFGKNALAAGIIEEGMQLSRERKFVHIPPPDLMFLQRKIVGIYLLAARLNATVNLNALLAPYIAKTNYSKPSLPAD